MDIPRPDGRVESFEVSIEYPSLDPFVLPDTFDKAGRFPRVADRHIEQDGRFCLWLPQTAPVDEFQRPGGLTRYLSHVEEFLVLQLMYDTRRKHGIVPYWRGEEWAHAADGHKQWFRETTSDLMPDQFEQLLDATVHPVNPGYRCPCGSGKRLGNCHKRWIKTLRRTLVDHPNVRLIGLEYLEELRNETPSKSA